MSEPERTTGARAGHRARRRRRQGILGAIAAAVTVLVLVLGVPWPVVAVVVGAFVVFLLVEA